MTDIKARILAAVSEDLETLEIALAEQLSPHEPLVREIAGHLLFSGGKRLRPLLALLSARICGYKGPDLPRFAVMFEYLHAATLLHDDVVDGARLRRGRTAAHHLWDPPTVVLTGDFLLARALSIAAATGRPAVIETVAWITENMAQGEIRQLRRKGDLALTEAEYMDVILNKTAVLFEGACRAAGQLADADADAQDALAAYGRHLGIAFQIADDLLDYTSDADALGKQVGADLREGKLTLPVILALDRAGQTDRDRMSAIISDPAFSIEAFHELVDLIDCHAGIDDARHQAAAATENAKSALAGFAPTATRDVFFHIADYALVRKH